MATQAKITFKALNGDSDLPERTLTLHQHLHTVQIGRASKTPSKGLQAAADNAWFDSPVMSRNHAEISFDAENKVIILSDTGSMHGTYVNEYQLPDHEPHELSNNDIVVFGAEVKRNTDTFPARVFQVNFELLPFQANISYAFPESDEEDYEISDDEDREDPSSEDGVSIESPPCKASEIMNAIDLTRDDSPADSDVECTGGTSVKKNIMDVLMGRPADIDNSADTASIAQSTENPPILVDTDDEDAKFSSDSDDQREVESGDEASSDSAVSLDEQEERNSDNEDDNVRESDEEDASFEAQDLPEEQSEQASGLLALSSILNKIPEEPQLDVPHETLDEQDLENDSDFGLSDAGAEGIRALFDNGLIDSHDHAYYNIDEDSDSDNLNTYEVPAQPPRADEAFEISKHVTFACLPSERPLEPATSHSGFSQFARLSEISSNQTVVLARQPSPSDAAMVKIANPSFTLLDDSAQPIGPHHVPHHESHVLIATSLGDKTGKHEFFAAREDNRAKIYGEGQPERNSSIFQPASEEATFSRVNDPAAEQKRKLVEERTMEERRARSAIAMKKFRERKRKLEEGTKAKSSESSKIVPVTLPDIRSVNSTTRSLSSPSYLDDHTQAPKPIRRPSPELDMTSAVSFNESKASLAFANQHINPFGRSGLSINDIIEGAADGHTSTTTKRKIDDISEAMENEIRVWASSSSAIDGLEGSVAMATLVPRGVNGKDQPETTPRIPTEASEQRPAKRLRKIVENIGYVALGGAALFGALVISAPDFL